MTVEEARQYFSGDKYAMKATGICIEEVGTNYAKVSLKVEEIHKGAAGQVMGGVMYTMADFAFAVASNTPDNYTVTTTSTITYLGQPKSDMLIAEAKAIKVGRTTSTYQVEINDSLGTKVAAVLTSGLRVR